VARNYARERIQGRAPDGPASPGQAADPIIVHPDVRRMLLTMRTNILAGRALALYAASKLDTVKFGRDGPAKQAAAQLVELLTPVVKAYCTDRGFQDCVLGQQVLGGHGYVQEWGQEQLVRDARIAQIYEGTNGIQALDLMGRKTVRCSGQYFAVLAAEIREFCASQAAIPALESYREALLEACEALQVSTSQVVARASVDPAETGAASYPYLEAMGVFLYGFMWLRMLAAAHGEPSPSGASQSYLDGLGHLGRFYFERIMPRYKSLLEDVAGGAEALMALPEDQF
jgi:hypothetical protein